MPSIRLNKAFKVVKDIKAYFHLESGFTRGAVPDPKKQIEDQANKLRDAKKQVEDQANKLRDAKKRVSKMRQTIRVKDRDIERLTKLTAAEAPTQDHQGNPKNRRRISSPGKGSLPDFLIIGVQKGGTSSLYSYLTDHPQVASAFKKELHYFDSDKFGKGEGWYRSNFPPLSSENGHRVITGEASPYYIYHPLAPKRAAQVVPNARLIALLRNPVDRAYSDYNHRLNDGIETLGFEEAIEAEEERIGGEKERMLADESYSSASHRRHSYLTRGVYVDQIREWHQHFDRDQLLILKSEDFFKETRKNMQLVCDFLGLPDWDGGNFGQVKNKRRYDPMSPAIREKLESYFEPHNKRLYDYLGQDFGW